jgi:Concanavalin A-like lectin/glucanases superfamily
LKMAAATAFASAFGSSTTRAAMQPGQPLKVSHRYRNGVLAKGPVAYWRLGESQGPIASDATQRGHNGLYFGNPTLGQAGAIHRDPNTAIRCNGMDYVEIANHVSFSQPTSGFGLTVEVWMRPDVLFFPGESADPYVYWLGKGVAGQQEWALRFYSGHSTRPNRISAYIFNPGGGEGAGAYFQDELVAGQWIHVVACYEPGDKTTQPPAGVHIYKNGVHRDGPPSIGTLYSNPAFNIEPALGAAPLRLGTRDFQSFFMGGLDEVAIYPRVLSPAEILQNYLNGIS